MASTRRGRRRVRLPCGDAMKLEWPLVALLGAVSLAATVAWVSLVVDLCLQQFGGTR